MKLFTKTLAVAAVLTLAGSAMAATYRVDPNFVGTPSWTNPNCWLVSGVNPANAPGASDDVIIDHNMNVLSGTADVAARTLDIDSGFTLKIESGRTLTMSAPAVGSQPIDGTIILDGGSLLTSTSASDHFDVSAQGQIRLEGTDPYLELRNTDAVRLTASGAKVVVNNSGGDCYVDGSGSLSMVVGSKIEVAPSASLLLGAITGTTKVHGAGSIERSGSTGTGNFYNQGFVVADVDSQALVLAANMNYSDESSATRWIAEAPAVSGNPVLQFDGSATGLVSQIYAKGKVQINAAVTTTGLFNFSYTGGQLGVGNTIVFTFGSYSDPNTPNLSPAGSGPYTLTGSLNVTAN